MSPDNPTQQSSSSKSPNNDDASALDREAKYVEDITQSKDRGHDDAQAETIKQEDDLRLEQDARVQTIARQAKEANAGSKEPSDHLNKDG